MSEEKIEADFTGTIKEYFDEEKTLLKKETPYQNGKLHGTVKSYQITDNPMFVSEKDLMNGVYEKVILETETPYINGQKHGTAKVYNYMGDIQSETPYIQGEKHGIEKEFEYHGDIICETPYSHGKREGVQRLIEGDGPGSPTIETEFHNDKENGLRKKFDGFDEICETVMFVDGEKQGLEMECEQFSLSRITNYVDGKKQGFEVNFDWWTDSIENIQTFSEGNLDGKTYLFEEGEVSQVDEYSKGELISSKNDRLTLSKARLEIPKILSQLQINEHREELKKQREEYETERLKDKFRKNKARREKEGIKLSGTVMNDKAVEAGLSLTTPVSTDLLPYLIKSHLKNQQNK